MYSVDFQEIEILQRQNKWDELTEIMVDAAIRLKTAVLILLLFVPIPCTRWPAILRIGVGLKVLHIAEVTGEKIIEQGLKKVGLLGTKFTMEEDFYKKCWKKNLI